MFVCSWPKACCIEVRPQSPVCRNPRRRQGFRQIGDFGRAWQQGKHGHGRGARKSLVYPMLRNRVPDVSSHFCIFVILADPGIVRDGSGTSFLGPRGSISGPGEGLLRVCWTPLNNKLYIFLLVPKRRLRYCVRTGNRSSGQD